MTERLSRPDAQREAIALMGERKRLRWVVRRLVDQAAKAGDADGVKKYGYLAAIVSDPESGISYDLASRTLDRLKAGDSIKYELVLEREELLHSLKSELGDYRSAYLISDLDNTLAKVKALNGETQNGITGKESSLYALFGLVIRHLESLPGFNDVKPGAFGLLFALCMVREKLAKHTNGNGGN